MSDWWEAEKRLLKKRGYSKEDVENLRKRIRARAGSDRNDDPDGDRCLGLLALSFGALAAATFVKWLLSFGGSRKKESARREEREELAF